MARISRTIAALLATVIGLENAAATTDLQQEPWVEVQASVETAFTATVSEYNRAIEASDNSLMSELRRCTLIENFTYLEDFHIEAAAEMSAACRDQLDTKYPQHPEIELARLGTLYGDDVPARSEELHNNGLAFWNAAQHAQLHVLVANTIRWSSDDPTQSEFHCMRAMEYDGGADCRIDAAAWYWRDGQSEVAIELLSSRLMRWHCSNRCPVTFGTPVVLLWLASSSALKLAIHTRPSRAMLSIAISLSGMTRSSEPGWDF